MVAWVFLIQGCAGPDVNFGSVAVSSNASASYMDSNGIQKSSERIARKQQLIDVQTNRRERVFFGGVSVFGNGLEAKDLPICSALRDDLQNELLGRLKNLTPANFEIANLGSGFNESLTSHDGLFMVLSLVGENAQTDKILQGKIRGQVSIFGQLMFLDAKRENQLVASYPLGIFESDLFDSPPSHSQLTELAKMGMVGSKNSDPSKAVSICDQVEGLLKNQAVAPRAIFAPIEVSPITFSLASEEVQTPDGNIMISNDQLTKWSDELSARFSGYLGTGSGLAINPYLPGGERRMGNNRVTQYASRTFAMRRGNAGDILAKLPVPSLLINFEVTSMFVKLDDKKSDAYTKIVDYCFTGILVAKRPLTGEVICELPIEFPVVHSKGLPRQLVKVYQGLVEKTYSTDMLSSHPNHGAILAEKLDLILNQIAREIAFPEEDIASRFGKLRGDVKLNAFLFNAAQQQLYSLNKLKKSP